MTDLIKRITKRIGDMFKNFGNILMLTGKFFTTTLKAIKTIFYNFRKNNHTRTWKMLNTLPADKHLIPVFFTLADWEGRIGNQKVRRQIYNFQEEFSAILRLIYYYPVVGKNEKTLRVYNRHMLDTLLYEVKQNIQIAGKDHTNRIKEVYTNLLKLELSINKFLYKIDNITAFARLADMTDDERMAIIQILSYIQEQIKTFHNVFKDIHAMHQQGHIVNNGIGIDIVKFFEEIDKIKKNIKEEYDREKLITAQSVMFDYKVDDVVHAHITPIKHNDATETTPKQETPKTLRSAMIISKARKALDLGGGDYTPDKAQNRPDSMRKSLSP